MAHTILPYAVGSGGDVATLIDPKTLRSQMSPELREACNNSPFLFNYLQNFPIDEFGMPTYFPNPSRKMGELDYWNLIYPIEDGLYMHVCPDSTGVRDHHIPIEPCTNVDVSHLLAKIDEQLVKWADTIGAETDKDKKRELIIKLVNSLCTTDMNATQSSRKSRQIYVTPLELEAVTYLVLRDKIGLGVLQPLLYDPWIEDISCSGVGHIFIEHKIFKSVQSAIYFATHQEVDEFAVWLGEWIKHPVTVRNPLVDAVLPDGSRINIVYGTEISKRGSNFTIRKAPGTPLSVLELIEFHSLNYQIAAYLSLMLESGLNTFVVGATASGKTTLLNAITAFIRSEAKIVTIEDTPEVQVPHTNWVQESTRHGGGDSKGSEVGMFQLLKAALRQRPEMIIVGEIRSVEAVVAFQAMQTGHGVMSTFHAATVEKLIQRLTGDPINIPKTYIDNLNVVIIQSAVRLANGKGARRVMSVNEIIGYDPVSESFSFLEAFRWNPATDVFEFPGYMNSYLLEQIIAPKRGIPPHRRKMVYEEVKRRARILEKLHKDKGVTDYYEIFQVLSEARKQNLF